MYDDHELQNDFAPVNNESVATFETAESAWEVYQGSGNPKTKAVSGHDPVNYFWFQNGDSAFFVWDTRAYRSDNFAQDDEHKTMLGSLQKQVFKEWLQSVREPQSKSRPLDILTPAFYFRNCFYSGELHRHLEVRCQQRPIYINVGLWPCFRRRHMGQLHA